MKIVDINNQEIEQQDIDMRLGYLVKDSLFIAHHAAEPGVEESNESGHYELIKEYPNGGKDYRWVVDSPAMQKKDPVEAWDEYEDVYRYIRYTQEELDEIEKNREPTVQEQIAQLKEQNQMLIDCLLDLIVEQ